MISNAPYNQSGNLLQRLIASAGALFGGGQLTPPIPPVLGTGHDDWVRLYSLCYDYYVGIGLYDDFYRLSYGQHHLPLGPALKNLRNPAYDAVEFYVSHVWPGDLATALPIEARSPAHAAAIRQVWDWSNWAQRKNTWVRRCAIFGDGFLKVTQPLGKDRVYLQLIDPRMVTEFDADERGFVTWIRLTSELARGQQAQTYYRSEVWSKDTMSVRIWEHPNAQQYVERLGTPLSETPLDDFGIDFLPFVHCPFRDLGERRGLNAFLLQKDQIDEVNQAVTRLHQLLFRYGKPTIALLAGGLDTEGRPMPAPSFGQRDGTGAPTNRVTLGDDEILEFPGASRMEFLVPPVNFQAHLDAIAAQMADLEAKLPEIRYYRLAPSANLSGVAIRTLLAPAVKKVEEVRTSLEAALQRADMMAMHIGAVQGLPGFESLGTFEAGDFAHTFTCRPVLPLDPGEEAAAKYQAAQAGVLLLQCGVSQASVIASLGYDPVQEAQLREATSADTAAALLAAFERGD